MFKAVPVFCYLGDMLSAGGCCEMAVFTCLQMLMLKFLPTATAFHQSQSVSSDRRIDVFNMREKCDDACSGDIGSGYTELSSA